MLKSLLLLVMTALLGGCAAMNRLSSEVSTYGAWPEGKPVARFVFDRLPSTAPEQQRNLEVAAAPALASAGFVQVEDSADADYVVQLGASVSADQLLIDDLAFAAPFGWHGGLHGGWQRRFGVGFGFGYGHGRFGGPFATPIYLRQVSVLVRERRSGRTVYETRASNSGSSPAINSLLPAMFEAALTDFPNRNGASRRHVTTSIRS